ncbi:MAG: T9SS type A sorting domain-containing protein, partial [Saprospiraceae bacterium]
RGWKQFKRWEYEMQSEINPVTGEFPKKTAQEVYEHFNLTHSSPRVVDASHWSSLGPDNSNGGYSGVGRLNCIAFHPGDISTFWVGAAAGGLWKTTDNGNTWSSMTDLNGVLAVSNIIIPSDYGASQTIYIGTGDKDGYDNRSLGVLKSTDDGNTWNETGLTFSINDNEMINKLLIDPSNNNILIAATTVGVYKTTDGGTTWNTQLSPITFGDMEFQPGNPNVIYGSTKNGEIYISTNGTSFDGPVFSDPNANRIELAVSPAQPTWVYAVAVNGNNGLYGIYKSTDSGASYQLVFDGTVSNLLSYSADGSESGGQGYYDLCIAASPLDANKIVVGGVNTWGSLNGGQSWTLLNHWVGDLAQEVHADKHSLTYRSNGDLFETNDGGVYESNNNGASWMDKTNGITISQMYRLGVSQTDGDDIITGLQDNGTKIHSGAIWFDQIGGDGMECLIDYNNVNIQYGTLYYGGIFRTTDHWQNNTEVTAFDAGDGSWITPFIIDPVDPKTLYAGYAEVWKSDDRGDTWTKISNFHTSGGLIQSMAISSSNPMVMYIAFSSNIWKTTDGGGHWTNTTNDLPSNQASIQSIAIKHNDPNTVWIALSGYTNPGVYRTLDGGMTWTNESAGLPPIPVSSVIENKLLMSDNLFAGTDIGVYAKRANEEWTRYSQDLPNVRISELEIYYAQNLQDSRMRAATFGRGLWETPIPFSSTPVSTPESKEICEGTSASLELLEFEGSVQWQSSADGINGWKDVTEGTGGMTKNYVTADLFTTTFYRASVTNGGNTNYSNTSQVTVIPIPDAAGPIAGDTIVCQGQQNIIYSVEPISEAGIYIWTLPNGVTGTSSSESISVNISAGTQSGTITVLGRNSVCDGAASQLDITILPKPSKPLIGSVVQPTCASVTGSVVLNNLPSAFNWTLKRIPDGIEILGSGSSVTVANLIPGSYSFMVINQAGCESVVSSTIIIHAHATNPPTPVVTVQGNILHSDASAGNQWFDANGPIPGETGQDFIALTDGDFYTIVTLNGCSSAASNSITIEMTGIENLGYFNFVKIYPNPVNRELFIELINHPKGVRFEMLNALGQVIHKGNVVKKLLIPTSHFSPGVYIIKLEDEGLIEFRKVVKQ